MSSQSSLFPQVSGVLKQGQGQCAGILPDITRNRHKGHPRSEEANAKVHPSKSELKTKILNFIRERVGSTTEEVATGLNLRYTTASGRISELRRDSALEDSGRTRPTSSGCAATVWITKAAQARVRHADPKHEQRILARMAVRNAIRRGEMTRKPCVVCSSPNSQAHHEDYTQPLTVAWLCRKHHTLEHAKAKGGAA